MRPDLASYLDREVLLDILRMSSSTVPFVQSSGSSLASSEAGGEAGGLMRTARLNFGRFDELITTLSIGLIGLLTAIVCFGFLRSQANVDFRGSFSGAIAGFLASTFLLGRLLRQLKASSTDLEKFYTLNSQELRELREKNQELQQKLIRGAPHPEKFEVEVDERQKLVVARPTDWEPGGGVLFQFQYPPEQLNEDDLFPARVDVSFNPITNRTSDRDKYYETIRANFESGIGQGSGPYRAEFIHIGGQPGGLKSLRVLAQAYARISVRPDPVTGTRKLQESYVTKDEFDAYLYNSINEFLNRETQATSNAALRANDALAKKVAPIVEDLLERGQLRDMREALELVHKEVIKRQSEDAGARSADSPQASPDPTGVTTEVRQGVAQVASQTTSANAREEVQVLPVGRVVVICHHSILGKIYFFEFADNAADYEASSEIFDHIVRSIRFLV